MSSLTSSHPSELPVWVFLAGASIFTFAMLLSIVIALVDDVRDDRYARDVHARYVANLRALDAIFQAQRTARRPRPGQHRAPYRPQPMYPAAQPAPVAAAALTAPTIAQASQIEMILLESAPR